MIPLETQGFTGAGRRRRAAFSLVELLTVIAIIAILAAITFPAVNAVRTRVRQSTCMSNMKEITRTLKQYQLDNRRYPDYLFGPAQTGQNMQQRAAAIAAGTTVAQGLYPDYVRSLDTFHCPSNTLARTPSDNAIVTVAKRAFPSGAETDETFYTYSSYEANPAIDPSTLAQVPSSFRVRYSRVWTDIAPPADPAARSLYSRQLFAKTPPDDTYVAMCTYHVMEGKVIVAFLNGQAKTLDLKKLQGFAATDGSSADFDMYRFGPFD